MLHDIGNVNEKRECLDILRESQPAFYMQALSQLSKKADEFGQERSIFEKEAMEDAEMYSAYCIAVMGVFAALRKSNKIIPLNQTKLTVRLRSGYHDFEDYVYTGEALNGEPHGWGRAESPSAIFEGCFVDGRPEGFCTKFWNNQIYAGEWRNGKEYGKGTYSHLLTGEYKNMFFYREDACNSGKQLNDPEEAFFKDDATPMTAVDAFWQEDHVSATPPKSVTRTH